MASRSDEDIRSGLLMRKAELNDRIGRALNDVSHRNAPLDSDFAEQAVQRENDEVLAAIADGARSELKQIEVALLRLDRGTYGLCLKCGRPIEPARLHAAPYADTCLSCIA